MKKRYKLLIAFGILCVLLLAAAGAYSIRITKVTFSGNNRYTDEALAEKIFYKPYSLNPLYCLWESKYGKKQEIPFIQSYDVELKGWKEAMVQVYEKSVVGYVDYKGHHMYFDKDGIVVESSKEVLENVAEVQGLEFSHIVLHKKLPVNDEDIFNYILNLTQMLIKYELPVGQIQFDEANNVTLCIENIRFQIGKDSYLNEKVARIRDLLPEAEGLSGVFYMENVTADTDTFRFVKDVK